MARTISDSRSVPLRLEGVIHEPEEQPDSERIEVCGDLSQEHHPGAHQSEDTRFVDTDFD